MTDVEKYKKAETLYRNIKTFEFNNHMHFEYESLNAYLQIDGYESEWQLGSKPNNYKGFGLCYSLAELFSLKELWDIEYYKEAILAEKSKDEDARIPVYTRYINAKLSSLLFRQMDEMFMEINNTKNKH